MIEIVPASDTDLTLKNSDDALISMWLHGKAALTQEAYEREARCLLAFTAKPIREITLQDLQSYQRSFTQLKSSSQATKTGIIKSLLSFAANASHSLDNGAPLSVVQSTLGHASVATTSRYLHARPNDGTSRYLKG